MPKLPIGMVKTGGASLLERIAGYAWLTEQITGNPPTDDGIRASLSKERLAASDENVASVRALVDRRRTPPTV